MAKVVLDVEQGLVGIIQDGGVFFIRAKDTVPLVKLGMTIYAGESSKTQKPLYCRLERDKLRVFEEDQPVYSFELGEEGLQRLSLLADLIDDARFIKLVVGEE